MTEISQEQYIVTARKWRPQRFTDVVGQEHVTRTLRNAVQSGRIHHAYIFNGPRGVGKTTTARILAKAVNCENPSADFEPCNTCASCLEINSGRSMDVIEIDGASNNSVDDVRKLRENARYPPVKGAYKMYIIDEVHMLSTSAFNALLKTLEEPPKHLLFVFATTEPHKVPATILSRCQRFDFRRMQVDEIATQLRHISDIEGITIDDESLAVIGKKGDGSMRDSQSIFDQVISFCGKNVEYSRVNEALNLIDQEFYFMLSKAIREHDVAKVLDIARQVFMRGYDLQECLSGLAEHFRNILTVLATSDTKLIEASRLHREQYTQEATHFQQADVLQFMSIVITTERELRFAPQPRLRFEFALIQMAKMDSAIQISDLLEELAELKKKLEDLTSGSINSTDAASFFTSLGFVAAPNSANATHEPQQSYSANPNAHSEKSVSVPKPNLTTFVAADDESDDVENDTFFDIPDTASQQAQTTTFVSAATLAAEWRDRLSANEDLDASLRMYVLDGAMTKVECVDNGFHIHADIPPIANLLDDKKHLLAEVLAREFGCAVEVVVSGGTQAGATSLFGDFLPQQAISVKPVFKAVAQEFSESDYINGSPLANTEAVSELGVETIAEEMERHALDQSIIDLFGAVEVVVRS